MLSLVKGSAAYRKNNGTISIAKDQMSVIWNPLGVDDIEKAIVIAVADITSMLKEILGPGVL